VKSGFTVANYFSGRRPLPIAHFQLPIVSQVESGHRLAIGNGQWAIFFGHGFRSVVLVILVNSFKISLQSYDSDRKLVETVEAGL
jgi:hypothetical protein